MRLVDANVLLYSVNRHSEHHEAPRRRLDEHRAVIVSFDRDFERFPEVRRIQP